jgi:hypothetical protein
VATPAPIPYSTHEITAKLTLASAQEDAGTARLRRQDSFSRLGGGGGEAGGQFAR